MKLPTAPLLLPDGEWKINLEYLKVVITLWPLTTITRHIYYILGRLFRITRNPAEAPAPTISPTHLRIGQLEELSGQHWAPTKFGGDNIFQAILIYPHIYLSFYMENNPRKLFDRVYT